MIVEQFIQWVVGATPEKRARATHALARAYIGGDFSGDDMEAAEASMTFLLDDPERMVRAALADVLAGSAKAPRHILFGLLDDHASIAALIAARSPLLRDDELVDLVAVREMPVQLAIAGRMPVSLALSAAIAEVTPLEVCLQLTRNLHAKILPATLVRLTERFGDEPEMQQLLLARNDLPIAARQLLIANLSDALCDCAVREARMDHERAEEVSREARDRATLTLARDVDEQGLPELITHLRDSEQLTTVLLLRAICAGQVSFFIEALALLAGVPRKRVSGLLSDNALKGLRTLYVKAGLPEEAYAAFAIAFEVYMEEGAVADAGDQYRFTRMMIERILERYRAQPPAGVDDLLGMLRRFASETARDAARHYVHRQIRAA